MNVYVKQFFHRGMLFGGFGPIIAGIVYWCVSLSVPDVSLTGGQMLLAIVSTYLLAFLHAGASVFNQIDHWPIAKSLLCHFGVLYVAYSLCYIVNTWIPFEPAALLVFTGMFAVIYLVVWVTVYLCIKATSKKFNAKIGQ